MPFAPVVKGILMELTDQVKDYLRGTAASLRGFDRPLFKARTVRLLGHGGPSQAERVSRHQGQPLGLQQRAEERLPGLLDDIRSVVDAQTQTDPTFRTQRLYTRLSAAEVRRQLIQRGHADAAVPSEETIRRKMHQAGYGLRRVAKCVPKKSCRRRTRSSTG